jgi:four helix bundle protein
MGRGGNAEFQRFLHMAMGSASELEYHLLLSRDLRFIEEKDHGRIQTQVVEVKRMLAGLIRKVDSDRR